MQPVRLHSRNPSYQLINVSTRLRLCDRVTCGVRCFAFPFLVSRYFLCDSSLIVRLAGVINVLERVAVMNMRLG